MSSKAEKRRLEILNIVNLDGVAYVSETARIFNVTGETIRSDFDFLAAHYDLDRIRGGIRRGKIPLFTQHYRYHDKKSFRVEEKRRICLRAVDLIEDGECIYIDSGSTVSYLLDFLSRKSHLTVVTPSVAMLMRYVTEGFEGAFSENRHSLVFAGGTVNANMLTTFGPIFDRSVADLNFDRMFFSTDAVDMQGGCTNSDEIGFGIVKRIAERTQTKILLADASKFGHAAKYRAMDWQEIDVLVTEGELDAAWCSHLATHSVRYVQA